MNADMDLALQKAVKASAEFIKRHHPQAEHWDNILGWCAWYISNGFMVALHREDLTILALACARPVNDPQDGNIPYKYCEDGDCIFIDFMAIEDHDRFVLPAFAIALVQRFGERKKVAYQRVSVHEFDGFMRNIGRIKKIGEMYGPAKST